MANKYIRHGATYNGDGLTNAVASGSTVTFTIASPGKVNWTGHGLAANALVYFGVTTGGVLPTGITAGTTYYVRNPGTNDFEVSATSGGASINFSGTPSGTANCTTTGAWNHIDILTGTGVTTITGGTQGGGAIAAGDFIYIRSKSEADADISVSYAATINIGSAAATVGSPVVWILDDGTEWSGKNGVLTFTSSTANAGIGLRTYNNFFALTKHNWVLENTNSNVSVVALTFGNNHTRGLKLNYPNKSSGLAGYGAFNFAAGIHDDMLLVAKGGGGSGFVQFSLSGSGELLYANNLEIELTATGSGAKLFGSGGYNSLWKLSGGRVFGAGTASGTYLFSMVNSTNNAYNLEAQGFQFPKTLELVPPGTPRVSVGCVICTGLDDGANGEIWAVWGNADSRNYSYNYPVLNATLPDSLSTKTSWRLIPENTNKFRPASLTFSKLYTSDAAQKKVTLEILVSNNWGAGVVDKSTVWMDVEYITSSGTPVRETTRLVVPGTDLDASSASWSSTSWGSVSFGGDSTNSRGKRKLELTTANSIKKDTVVSVVFFCLPTSANVAYDMFIIDPDVQLTTP